MSTTTEMTGYDPEVAAGHEQPPQVTARTAESSRTESIGRALESAYAKASTLLLTDDEAARLGADFPDDAFRSGAGGDDDLIYIEHAYLRKRLNDVLGIGAVVPIRRREWTEKFQYWKKFGNGDKGEWRDAVCIYVDLVLIVRGCVVGEAIGDATYYPDNAKASYSDALESAKSNAFRRCCKEFGIGLQAWMKGWGDGWWQRNPSGRVKPQSSSKTEPSKNAKAEPPAQRETAAFVPPKDWPETEIHDLKLWIDSFSTAAHFKTALGMFLNEPAIANQPADWEPILRHFAETYKKKAQTPATKHVATTELNTVIKAALDKMELDKAADEMLNREAAEAAS